MAESLGEAVFPVPQHQQAALSDGDLCRFSGKMIADTQREAGGEGAVLQGVMQSRQRDTFRIGTHAEDGDLSPAARREPESAAAHHGDVVIQSRQIPPGPVIADINLADKQVKISLSQSQQDLI